MAKCDECDKDLFGVAKIVRKKGRKFCSEECKEAHNYPPKGNMQNKQKSRGLGYGVWRHD